MVVQVPAFAQEMLLAGTVAGFLLAGLYGAALLISGRTTRKQHIPFASGPS